MFDYSNIVPELITENVGKPVDLVGKNIEQIAEDYEKLFIGCYILTQSKQSTEGIERRYQRALDWLRTTDFYTAPASTRYHEAFPGGLVSHSIKVYNKVIDLLKTDTFKSVPMEDAAMVSLIHDWCKIDFYESYTRNVKDDKTGKWRQEPGYTINQKGLPLGHGATSLYLASRVMVLTPEQALAIRWHMGRWNVAKVEEGELQKANEAWPIVHLLQFADQLAVTNYWGEYTVDDF